MCELLGFSGAAPCDTAQFLRSFVTHACLHPHGWGLMTASASGFAAVKEPARADESLFMESLLRGPLETNVMIGHIRYATVGNVAYTNCHPFVQTDRTGREWVLFHNGTMFHEDLTAPYLSRQVGDTDSERILLYLIDKINEAAQEKGMLNRRERFRVLERKIANLSEGNKLNLLIYDGRSLYVHTNMAGTLFQKELEHGILFATVPLDGEGWEPVPMQRVLVYRDGDLLYAGEKLSAEYIQRPEDLDRLYQVFSQL